MLFIYFYATNNILKALSGSFTFGGSGVHVVDRSSANPVESSFANQSTIMSKQGKGQKTSEDTEVSQFMKFLIEERRIREAEAEKREQQHAEAAAQREREHAQHLKWMQERQEAMKSWMERYQARDEEMYGKNGWPGQGQQEISKCNTCGQVGHLAHSCWKLEDKEDKSVKEVKNEWSESIGIDHCKNVGHKAVACPEVYFCKEGRQVDVTRRGLVDGTWVDDIVLDTGCSRTVVRRELVKDDETLEGCGVTVRCAHGDTVFYLLAHVQLELDGMAVEVEAAVSDDLPVSVLLGTDVTELGRLLQSNPSTVHSTGEDRTLEVMRTERGGDSVMRSPNTQQDQQELNADEAETRKTLSDVYGSEFDDDIFGNLASDRKKLTRSQKRAGRQKHAQEQAMNRLLRKVEGPVQIDMNEIQEEQELDESLTDTGKRSKTEREVKCRWSGSMYVLVVCNYATRYPAVVPLRSIEQYSMIEKGALAIQLGIDGFRAYLRNREVLQENDPRLKRWSRFQLLFMYKVIGRPGKIEVVMTFPCTMTRRTSLTQEKGEEM